MDGLNFATTNSYDALNRVTQTVDRASGTTLMAHDDADQMTQYTDPRGIDTDFTHNGFGEVVQEVSADRGTIAYSYNDRGLVSSMTDARGIVSNYTYDDGGRLTERAFPSSPFEDQTFSYDFSNNGSEGEGKIGFIYDESGSINPRYSNGGYLSQERRIIETTYYPVGYQTDSFGRRCRTRGSLPIHGVSL